MGLLDNITARGGFRLQSRGLPLACLAAWMAAPTGLRAANGSRPIEPNAGLPTLTNAIQVVEMPAAVADSHFPVQLQGVVTFVDPRGRWVFVQDATGGVIVFRSNGVFPIAAGDLVEVRGASAPSRYASAVVSPQFQVLGRRGFPQPVKASFADLHAGRVNRLWTEVEGIVRSATTNRDGLELEIASNGSALAVSVVTSNQLNPERWIEARVRLQGVASAQFNAKGQFVSPRLLSPSPDLITLVEPARSDPFSLPVTPLSSLGHMDEKQPGSRIHVQGVVTLFKPGEVLYLREQTNGIAVNTTQSTRLEPGDRVDVIGFYERTEDGLVIQDGIFRRTAAGPPPAPWRVTVADLMSGRFDAELVTLPARVLEWRHGSSERIVALQASNGVFTARLRRDAALREFPVGSLVQATGVCLVHSNRKLEVQSFELYLRSPADLALLEGPPWWTTTHVAWIVAGLLVIGLCVLGWVAVLARANNRLERRVAERTADLQRENAERKRAEEALRASEARLQMQLDLMPVACITAGPDLRVTSWNPAAAKMFGHSASETVGQPLHAIVHPTTRAQVDGVLRRALQGEMNVASVNENQTKDGRRIVCEWTNTPLRTPEREVVGILCMAQDITERRRAEVDLANSLSLLHSTLEATADGILVVNLEGRITSFNDRFAELWRLPRELLASGDDEQALAAVLAQLKDADAFLAKVRDLYAHPEAESQDVVEFRDGRVFERSSRPQRLDGRCVGRVWCFRDVTARHQAETELAYERDLLQALLDYSPDHIYFKDRQSRFLKCSKRLAELFGVGSPEAVLGKTDFDFFDDAHARPAFEDEQEIIRSGHPMVNKLEPERWKDGRKTSWALTSKVPLRNRTGQVIGTVGISKDVTAMKEAEAQLEQVHKQLVLSSRLAGMAEVATGVLHNVGNVLNSINVSTTLLSDRLRKSKVASLARAAALMREHTGDLGEFFTTDPKGRQLPEYLTQLAQHLGEEQTALLKELGDLSKNVEHIKDIVAMQQSYARISGVAETVPVTDLVEDALRMNAGALARHDVHVNRDYPDHAPTITVDKHKVLQVLVNLIRNAKYACDDSGRPDKRLTVQVNNGSDRVRIAVIDNGVGISPENLTKIFNHGFTTRKEGHGFGLHSGALAARELGGALNAHSDGPGLGATFTLELPLQPPPTSHA